MQFSVGIGLTNECNLRCAHCYRPDATIDRLTLEDVRRVLCALTVRSVNIGVGENGMHPQYADILDELASQGVKTSITSNGQSIAVLPDVAVKRFHSVEFSLDFPTEHVHDLARGRGNWRTVMDALERCAGTRRPDHDHRGDDEHELHADGRAGPRGHASWRTAPRQHLSTIENGSLHPELRAILDGVPDTLRVGTPRRHVRTGAGGGSRHRGLRPPRLRALHGARRAGWSRLAVHLLAGERAHHRRSRGARRSDRRDR